MKVLLVSNEYPRPGIPGNPIIGRLRKSIEACSEVETADFCPFTNKFSDFKKIRSAAKTADIVHIQFGGLYALLVWMSLIGVKKPKLLTFHGTDIHAKAIKTSKSYLTKLKIWLSQKASFLSILLFDKLGFVSDTLIPYVPNWIQRKCKDKLFVQALGVDYALFVPTPKSESLKKLGIEDHKYALFSDISGTPIKRRDIAEAIIDELGDGYQLLIMCKVKPEMVPVYINACDFVLLTSDQEGSPNITREAMSLNKRVFSVDVGDVKQQIAGLKNSAIISREPKQAAETIRQKLSEDYTDNTRETLRNRIDFVRIADGLVQIYKELNKINTYTN